ncbi:glycosyltransferase [Salegentibacter sp.]|uniref:glycosyltransferase n=1 Tax=Salegentibacter sp. TaxID=1903072 RepID=UPI003568E52E
MKKKRILVAALNWGLGHATRCIPIINGLIAHGYEPIIASDGAALSLLKKEFPDLQAEELPSYNIEYSAAPNLLKWKLFLESPRIIKVIKAEKKETKRLVEKYNLNGIISDNRLGVRYRHLKCVFITHQLNVLSGNTTWLSSKLHQKYIRKFDECWVPDLPGSKNLSGFLGHMKKTPEEVKYMGPLSRFSKKDIPKNFKIMILLSGPEPQRSILEKILLQEFKETSEKTLFVRGVLEESEFITQMNNPNLEIRNYLFGEELEKDLNSSEIIVCRSGYTSIMDLSKLEKKAFLIPTPGQFEQEYLAERLDKLGVAPFCTQSKFKISELERLKSFSGFRDFGFVTDFGDLFTLFKGK